MTEEDNTTTRPNPSEPRLDDSPCSPPNVVWIQYHGDSDPVEWGPEEPSEVTWSAYQVFEHDVEYVRADLVRELLKGHKCSELLGDGGLIAATMRSFEANALEHAPHENQ